MAAELAPCAWDPIECGCALFAEESGEFGPYAGEAELYAAETASYVIWALSGRQFGCCELTLRPCRRGCDEGLGGGPWGAYLLDGSWYNAPCRRCSAPCACSEVSEVRLPHAPACSVVEVVMDGEVINAGNWRLEDDEWLVVTNGSLFPDCQDMSLALGDAGTWGVTYEHGVPPPTAGRRAVGALACEILKACRNDASCCLPKRTQSFNRQGFSAVLLDPFEFFDRHRTGIYEVDLFLMASNPEGRPAGARVVSPDTEPRARHVWP